MKTIIYSLFLLVCLSVSVGCSKKEDEAVIDCFGESLLVHLKESTSTTNSKEVTFKVEYSGSNTVCSINWEFGDGTKATTTTLTTTHVYGAAGSFTAKANVNLSSGNGSCTISPTKTITVN